MMTLQKVVITMKTGIQVFFNIRNLMDSGFRRNDGKVYFQNLPLPLLALCALLVSCMPAEYVVPSQADNAETVFPAAILGEYPREFRASHRIVLQINDKEYDCIGYITKDGANIRALAFGEMGGKVFDIVLSEKGSEVLLKPDGMRDGLLSDGVLGDLAHVYRVKPASSAYTASRPDGGFSMVASDAESGGVIEYLFSNVDGHCEESVEIKRGKVVRRARFMDYAMFSGWDKPLPSVVVVSNNRWHYLLRMELLEFHVGPQGGGPVEQRTEPDQ